MAKKIKAKRTRSFKVCADFYGIPFIRFGGKYLNKELGLTCGDRLKLTRDGDAIILRKFSAEELTQYETQRKEKAFKELLTFRSQAPSMMVAENRSTYSVDEEISKHHEKYLQD